MRVKNIENWFLCYHILIIAPELNYNKKQVCINSGEIKITFVSNGTRVICTRWQKGFRNITCHLLFRYTYKKILKKYHFRFIHMNYFQRAVLISLFISWSWFEKNYELDVCCSSSSSSSSSSFISLCVRTNFKVYSKLLDEETSRNHQAYSRGHLSSQLMWIISLSGMTYKIALTF